MDEFCAFGLVYLFIILRPCDCGGFAKTAPSTTQGFVEIPSSCLFFFLLRATLSVRAHSITVCRPKPSKKRNVQRIVLLARQTAMREPVVAGSLRRITLSCLGAVPCLEQRLGRKSSP